MIAWTLKCDHFLYNTDRPEQIELQVKRMRQVEVGEQPPHEQVAVLGDPAVSCQLLEQRLVELPRRTVINRPLPRLGRAGSAPDQEVECRVTTRHLESTARVDYYYICP